VVARGERLDQEVLGLLTGFGEFLLGGVALLLVLLIAGMFMYTVNSLIQAAALDIVEGQRLEGTFIGLSWGFNGLFNGVSPLLAGALAEKFGFKATFYYAAVALILGFLLASRLPKLKARKDSA